MERRSVGDQSFTEFRTFLHFRSQVGQGSQNPVVARWAVPRTKHSYCKIPNTENVTENPEGLGKRMG